MSQNRICHERIEFASGAIDPVFRNTPLLWHDELNERTGASIFVKVETVNPIRSFKGRGTDLFIQELPHTVRFLVAASAGNFGQGLAYGARKTGRALTVFVPEKSSSVKVSAMKRMGAEVHFGGTDMDDAKELARNHAEKTGAVFVEDGAHPAFAEGAGTIAHELTQAGCQVDTILIPVGNGALLTGMGTWMKHASSQTRVIGVVAEGAPAMQLSFLQKRPVETQRVNTIADGMAVRVPVPFSLQAMYGVVDEVISVSDSAMLTAMKVVHRVLGLVVEPSGVTGLAAILADPSRFRNQRVATVFAGGNLCSDQVREWLLERDV